MTFDPQEHGDAQVALEKLTDLKPYQKKHTPCVNCVFADYEQVEGKLPTQIGCKVDMLSKLSTVGNAEIIAASDGERNFYIVAKRDCPGNRSERWVQYWTDKGIDDAIEAFRQDFYIRFDAIVVCTANNTLEEVEKSVINLKKKQSVVPRKILVTNQNYDINPFAIRKIIKSSGDDKIDWSVEQMVDVEASVGRCIDLAVKKVKCPFYLVVQAGETLPFDYVGKINSAFCDKLKQFVIITPIGPSPSLTGLYCSVKAHKAFKGFAPAFVVKDGKSYEVAMTVIEKIRDGLKEEECLELLLTPKDIDCPK